MEHESQHREAISKTIKSRNEVTVSVFDDKVKEMGTACISGGKIVIELDYVPSMVGRDTTRDFLLGAIGLSLSMAYDAKPKAFDKFS